MSDEDDDDEASFVFDGSDIGEYEDNAFDKVWVEQRAIEDASPHFHKWKFNRLDTIFLCYLSGY